MADEVKQTILEDGTEVEGSIKSRGPITVSGKVKGEVSAPSLLVTQSGAVHGQVKVSQLKSQGEVAGEIDADSVELSGRVNDQTIIKANTLEVTLNRSDNKLQVSFGNCELQVGGAATPKQEQKPKADAPPQKPQEPKQEKPKQ